MSATRRCKIIMRLCCKIMDKLHQKKLRWSIVLCIVTLSVIGFYVNYSPLAWENNWHGNDTCHIPQDAYKGWRDGVVTLLNPVIERDCAKVLAKDENETSRLTMENKKWRNALSDNLLLKSTKNCTWVEEYFHDNLYTTHLEREFPIAYSFVVYNNAQQVLRLLKFLYRPTNFYCIHTDKKSDETFSKTFRNLATCLKNVIIPSRLLNVTWGHYSLMEAQMSCLEDLVHLRSALPEHRKWRYVINLCGKELPLVSTHTIVSLLSKLNGTSSFKAYRVKPSDDITMSRLRGKEIPFGLTFYKSMTSVALSYPFAHFLLTNTTAIHLHKFFQNCYVPEEHFYATLFMAPGIPGGFNPHFSNNLYFHVPRYTWMTSDRVKNDSQYRSSRFSRCSGEIVHDICIVSVNELKAIVDRNDREMERNGSERGLFYNKYFMELDHSIMDCMEERLVAINMREYEEDCPRLTDQLDVAND